jgi:hypothetical protein
MSIAETDDQMFERARLAQRALRDRIRSHWPDLHLGGIGLGDHDGAWVLRVNITGDSVPELPTTFKGFPVEVDFVTAPMLRGRRG